MVREELISRSPLRILEKSTQGGLGRGNIGVIAAAKGTGKTACLVHIATDQLFQDKHVIHISFADTPDHIVAWYEDIFNEVSRRYRLVNAVEIHDQVVRNRVIMNFRQSNMTATEMERKITALVEKGNFHADTLVVDGFNFKRSNPAELREIRKFCSTLGLEAWFSMTLTAENSERPDGGMAALDGLLDEIAVIVTLRPHENRIRLQLVKDHESTVPANTHLMLDPKILLISEE